MNMSYTEVMSGPLGLVVIVLGLVIFSCFAYAATSRWGPGAQGAPMMAVAVAPTSVLMGLAWAFSFWGEGGLQKAQFFVYGSLSSLGVAVAVALLQCRAKRRMTLRTATL